MHTAHRIATVLVSAPLMLGLGTAVASADPSGEEGIPNADETPQTGQPDSVGTASQFAHALKDAGSSMGDHSNNFAPGQNNDDGGGATGRQGVGNVARNDGDPGTNPNDHFAFQTTMDGLDATDPSLPPGNNNNPNRGNPNG